MNHCEKVQFALNEYFAGECEANAIDWDHLKDCVACTAEHRELSQLSKLIETEQEQQLDFSLFKLIAAKKEKGSILDLYKVVETERDRYLIQPPPSGFNQVTKNVMKAVLLRLFFRRIGAWIESLFFRPNKNVKLIPAMMSAIMFLTAIIFISWNFRSQKPEPNSIVENATSLISSIVESPKTEKPSPPPMFPESSPTAEQAPETVQLPEASETVEVNPSVATLPPDAISEQSSPPVLEKSRIQIRHSTLDADRHPDEYLAITERLELNLSKEELVISRAVFKNDMSDSVSTRLADIVPVTEEIERTPELEAGIPPEARQRRQRRLEPHFFVAYLEENAGMEPPRYRLPEWDTRYDIHGGKELALRLVFIVQRNERAHFEKTLRIYTYFEHREGEGNRPRPSIGISRPASSELPDTGARTITADSHTALVLSEDLNVKSVSENRQLRPKTRLFPAEGLTAIEHPLGDLGTDSRLPYWIGVAQAIDTGGLNHETGIRFLESLPRAQNGVPYSLVRTTIWMPKLKLVVAPSIDGFYMAENEWVHPKVSHTLGEVILSLPSASKLLNIDPSKLTPILRSYHPINLSATTGITEFKIQCTGATIRVARLDDNRYRLVVRNLSGSEPPWQKVIDYDGVKGRYTEMLPEIYTEKPPEINGLMVNASPAVPELTLAASQKTTAPESGEDITFKLISIPGENGDSVTEAMQVPSIQNPDEEKPGRSTTDSGTSKPNATLKTLPKAISKISAKFPSGVGDIKRCTVTLRLWVELDGTPSDIRVHKIEPELDEAKAKAFGDAATEAVKETQFTPGTRNRIPVRKRIEIQIYFKNL